MADNGTAADHPTREITAFLRTVEINDVPPLVLERAKRSLLDGLGLAVAGSTTRAAEITGGVIGSYGRLAPEAAVLGTSTRMPARFAAFMNGLAIHAHDFDDTQLAVRPDRVYGLLTHPTAPVLPVALALSERADRSGRDLLLGYLIGIEIATKLAEAISPRHYDDGFHSTGTLGAIGGAAAASRLLELDDEKSAVALGIAASQSGGLREHFGTMTKPFHAGHAAESAVFAAELARDGFTAATNALEAKRGFFNAAGGGYDPTAIHGVLGDPWTFDDPGISIKPHPSGSLTHPGMGAFLELVLAEDLRPEYVERITVGTNRHMPNALIHHRPATELEAKFSMEFCMAILLIERRAGLAQFTDEVVRREDVRRMIDRVEFGVHPDAEAAGYNNMTTIIGVDTTDGRHFETSASFGKGSPQNPMSDDELIAKFAGCLEWGGRGAVDAVGLAQRVLDLESETSVRDLLSVIAPR